MEPKRWIGSHDWKRSNESVDGYPSRNERGRTNTEDLDDLIHWLEYGKTSGYIAARNSKEQEEHWAQLLRNMLCEKLIKDLKFYDNNSIQFECVSCGNIVHGFFYSIDKTHLSIPGLCKHLEPRFNDIVQYILNEFQEWSQ